jgi:peptidoglycan/xylan/chitin deacetylase (PgdA/CDA1 family)
METELNRYPRDFRGHGPNPPDARWPGGAKIAVSIVLNYEEGGENSILHGDAQSEAFLSDIAGAAPWPGQRHWNMESIYDYGARAGFWRLHRLFVEKSIPVTVYGVTSALARNPEQVAAMKAAGWEIASHGLNGSTTATCPPRKKPPRSPKASACMRKSWAPPRKAGTQVVAA